MRYIPLIIFVVFFPMQVATGQYYETGQDPSSLRWMQIKTGRFKVIYPEKYGEAGINFARSLDRANSGLTQLFPEKKFQIPVVIHSFSTQSNGYVAWAPRRMEIYPTPDQNSVPGNQNEQLALHELTHVYEMEALNTGVSGILSFILGEQSTGIIASLLPLWYLEGDAVYSESILSGSGRGHHASFQKQVRALTVSGIHQYKYDKIVNGSFRDHVPDHYQYGYQMVTWAKAKYDPHIWNKALKFTAEEPFTLNPVGISLRKNTGLTKKKLYKETFDTLKTIWLRDTPAGAIQYKPENPEKNRDYINYYSPVFAGHDSIIAIKTSLSSAPAIVLINPSRKTEKIIQRPGYMYPWLISYAAGKLLWAENKQDARWDNRDFYRLRILDLKNHILTNLPKRTRYLAVSLSPDGRSIIAVENTADNKNNLVFINAETGEIMQSVASPENVYLQRPQWSEDGKKITVIYLTEHGEGIMSYSPAGNKWESLIIGKNDLQSSFLRNDTLFFVSSVTGTENIFLYVPGTEIKQITRSEFGATDPNINGNNILFSDYSAEGNSVCITGINQATGMDPDKSQSSFLINRMDINQKPIDNPEANYTPVPYRKWQHLFRFHSWMPFYADIEKIQSDPLSIRPGVTVMTQNSLSTLISSVGYEYSQNKMHVLHSTVTWKGLYPVIESKLDYGNDPGIFGNPPLIMPGLKFSNAISLPLRFSSGRFSQYLRPSVISEYSNNIYQIREGVFDYGQTNLTGRIYFSNSSRMALRDIYPEWAQVIDLNYVFAPFDKLIFGSTVYLKSSFFFPGFFRDNGIKIRFETESQDQSKYIFGNSIGFPRGYRSILSRKIKFGSIDYVFPVAYPDFSLSSLLYIKRIRSGLFYDYASGTGNRYINAGSDGTISISYHNYTERFSSFGLELLTDFHVFRIPFMITGGAQAAWKNIHEQPIVNLIFNIDLYGMTLGRRQ